MVLVVPIFKFKVIWYLILWFLSFFYFVPCYCMLMYCLILLSKRSNGSSRSGPQVLWEDPPAEGWVHLPLVPGPAAPVCSLWSWSDNTQFFICPGDTLRSCQPLFTFPRGISAVCILNYQSLFESIGNITSISLFSAIK